MLMLIRINCAWCGTGAALQHPDPTYCVKCYHRADRAKEECDCLTCTARRSGVVVHTTEQQPQPTQATGTGIRAGRLVTSVSAEGVTRRVVDAEDDNRSVEIFESRSRAVQVFLKVWETLPESEQVECFAEMIRLNEQRRQK